MIEFEALYGCLQESASGNVLVRFCNGDYAHAMLSQERLDDDGVFPVSSTLALPNDLALSDNVFSTFSQ